MRVKGEGPTPCDIAWVGEGPGWQEDKQGRPFVGRTGEEIEHNLESNGLPPRREGFFTNLFREYMGTDYVWTQEDIERDELELLEELRRVRPHTIVTLGRYATRWMLGDVDMDGTWGLPWLPADTSPDRSAAVAVGTVVFPIHHPAAALHNAEMSPYVVAGFQRLKKYLDGDIQPRKLYDDSYLNTVYEEITNEQQLRQHLSRLTGASRLSIDTEGWPGAAWSLQFCFEPGTGFLVKSRNRELMREFIRCVRRVRPRIVFHSALHDLSVGRELESDFSGLEFDDTMVMAYLLQTEPQGLKAGALRNCNMKMMEYAEIVGDRENGLAREYLTWVWDGEEIAYRARQESEFLRLTTTPYLDAKGKLRPGRQLKVLPKLPRTPLQKAATRIMSSKRPAGLWEDQVEDLHVAAYHVLGPMPRATLDYIDPKIAIPYGCRDADATRRLLDEYSPRIDAMGLRHVYDLEIATQPLLDRMMQIGIKPNLEHFKVLSEILQIDVNELQRKLEAATGVDGFNANSGDQVANYIFGTLGLQEMKMTSGGRGSTNDKILEALEHEHPEYPVLTDIRQYREIYKLKHTFVDRLPDFVHRWPFDGRIHTTIRATRVVTGRLAATDPNLLAQPEYGKWAKEFKRGWVAEEGRVFYVADQSQIELRGLAHLSQDPTLLAIYRGELRNSDGSLIDLHAKTAQAIFGGDVREYMEKGPKRLAAKAVNFGIPMGMTNKGLSVELRKNGMDADEDTAQRWLDETLGLYAGISRYMESRIEEARRNGFVRCLSGRIRYIGGIRSRDDRVREEAERFAFSTPIQESAAYIMKQAEVTVWNDVLPYFWKQDVWCEPLLQQHDSLKMEIEKGRELELHTAMRAAMVNVKHGFDVPLEIEAEVGPTFADVKKVHND